MRIDILSLFPEMFDGPFASSIIKRACDREIVSINIHNIREYTHDRHRVVDDSPYGGGAGMVMKPEPLFEAVEALLAQSASETKPPVVLLSAQGRPLTQSIAREMASHRHIILICGHYEGVDERIRQYLATDDISIGDYVLSGGELPAMVLADAVLRLVPGVLGSSESSVEESHTSGLLEYPHYTRPPVFRGYAVPDVLLSGDHARIARWRHQESLKNTLHMRPDLLTKAELSGDDKRLLEDILNTRMRM